MDFSGIKNYLTTVNASDIEMQIASESKLKGFEPGTFTLKIKAADLHKNKVTGNIACEKDPSWFNVMVVLESADGRTTQHYLQIPTKKLTYNETNSKSPYYVFRNLQKFMGAVGIELTVETVGEVIPAFFANDGVSLTYPEKLIGQTVTVDIGFSGSHVRRNDEGKFILVNKKNAILDENGKEQTFVDLDSAKIVASELGIRNLQTWPSIVNFHVGVYVKKEAPKTLKTVSSPW
jgi:hypothetical protein